MKLLLQGFLLSMLTTSAVIAYDASKISETPRRAPDNTTCVPINAKVNPRVRASSSSKASKQPKKLRRKKVDPAARKLNFSDSEN